MPPHQSNISRVLPKVGHCATQVQRRQAPAARRKFRVHMFIHVLSDLTDDALELILLQLVAVGDIIAAAATARHWRVICDVRWPGQRTAIDLRWEELVDAHFK